MIKTEVLFICLSLIFWSKHTVFSYSYGNGKQLVPKVYDYFFMMLAESLNLYSYLSVHQLKSI
jgi:hypothetical protein